MDEPRVGQLVGELRVVLLERAYVFQPSSNTGHSFMQGCAAPRLGGQIA